MKRRLKSVAAMIPYILLGIIQVITIVLVLMRFMGETPNLLGYRLYYIVTGSMEPEIHVGDMILNREIRDSTVFRVGDVVSFMGESGEIEGKLITHKIIEITGTGEDQTIITKGVANSIADDPMNRDQIVSRMVFRIPLLGKFFTVINSKAGFLIVVIIPILSLLIHEINQLIKLCKRDKEDIEDDQPHGKADK